MGDQNDIFKNPPVRYLGYANEVGEAFRGIIPNIAVLFSYGIATSYVLAHTIHEVLNTKKKQDESKAVYKGFDTFIWQMLASVAIPGYTINRSCFCMSLILNQTYMSGQKSKILVTGFGLILIPFIIEPIDKSVDYIMDKAIRPPLKKIFQFDEK